MKIAVTSRGTSLESQVDPRFGRAAYLLIIDPGTLQLEVIDNRENVHALKGSGIQAACTLSENGVKALLTGYCGPNAFKALKEAKIKVAGQVSGLVKDAVTSLNQGRLTFIDQPNAQGRRKD
ncbi:MAG: dinitrogenase iron-molybdenum cofactor biosynthesis protein [Desulfobacteraceae bacterium]|nr:dinitrogenase iron-molybdenum cofactor biosynthesis protein [Desulfobacteraceae bacterium]